MRTPRVTLFLLIISLHAWSPFPQKVSTSVKVYDNIFLSDTGSIPLPVNGVGLARKFTIESDFFRSPIKLASDQKGILYTSERDSRFVQSFDIRGKYLKPIGVKANGKPLFHKTSVIHESQGRIVVHDSEKGSLEFLSFQGAYLKSQEIPEFDDFAIGENDLIFAALSIKDKESPLVTVYSPDGYNRGFGAPLFFRHSLMTLNSRSLALNEKGDIFVAFTYFPILRRYSSEGRLMAEYRIENPIMKDKENYNLKMIGEGIADPTQRVGFKPLIIGIKVFADKIYLLSNFPRLEIAEIDETGKCASTYWADSKEIYEANDFAILEENGEKLFFVSHSHPPRFDVDVFVAKKPSWGLQAEIDEMTDEIALYPDNDLPYNNRGAAKHLAGNYRGAIEDFSKAIELAPNSGLAYDNRGRSRLKIEDFDGAISDFTKTIELNSKDAGAFYNRGIAHIRKKNYENAIKDFENAAILDPKIDAKAKEQIGYCQARLKKKMP